MHLKKQKEFAVTWLMQRIIQENKGTSLLYSVILWLLSFYISVTAIKDKSLCFQLHNFSLISDISVAIYSDVT